jgi:polar amino acid transport system substrate-binding protein
VKSALLAFFLLALFLGTGRGEDVQRVLRIGIDENPPYAAKEASGEWSGIAVDLWNSIAVQTGIRFEFVETPPEKLLSKVADGKLDVALGEIEVTAEAEKVLDFTQAYLVSGIGVALQDKAWHPDWISISKEFFNWTLVQILLAILAGMVIVSFLIWLVERHHQLGHFRGGLTGFGSALWFSAATMTSVGYGDKTPSTFLGRLISFVWMLAGVLLVAGFTAAVAASVTAARVNEIVTRPSDLARVSCAVVAHSVPQHYLKRQGIPAREYDSIKSALAALSNGEVEAVVADRISLRYLAKSMAQDKPPVRFKVSPVTFRDIFIAIPVRDNLPEYNDIKVALLNTIFTEKWQDTLRSWLGRDRE